jgi:16S rRNA (uracil1498-N3)-methyltransferase
MQESRSSIRLYFPGDLAAGSTCVLPAAQAHHASRVLRLRAGDAVTLFNGDGAEYACVIARLSRDRVTLDVGDCVAVDRESPLAVRLAQAVSSGDRMDYTVQKAVELGVVAIQPLISSRSVVRLDAERADRRMAHWQTVVAGACEQCGRNRVPPVAPVATLYEWLARPVLPEISLRVLLTPRAASRVRDLSPPAGTVVLLAGPEGGFAPEEERMAEQAGYVPVRLGSRVLRTETAAVAALAAMQTLWGDF